MAQQSPAMPRSGLDSASDSEGWAAVAREHYNTSILPWIGRKGEKWLRERTRPSNDPNLVLVTEEIYTLWKSHAIGAGAPFPRDLLKKSKRSALALDSEAEQMTPSGRATLVLGALLVFTAIFCATVLLLPH